MDGAAGTRRAARGACPRTRPYSRYDRVLRPWPRTTRRAPTTRNIPPDPPRRYVGFRTTVAASNRPRPSSASSLVDAGDVVTVTDWPFFAAVSRASETVLAAGDGPVWRSWIESVSSTVSEIERLTLGIRKPPGHTRRFLTSTLSVALVPSGSIAVERPWRSPKG